MMHRPRFVWILAAAMIAACSKSHAPENHSEPTTTRSVASLPAETADILRAKLTAGGFRTDYAAYFAANELTRIVEQRRMENDVLGGEYDFKGARLLRYRGAKLTGDADLDLGFDMQGVLQSGAGPNVGDEDIRAVRNRAQLLRSHALAQRASRMHQ
jgi:hypothetical protein